MSWIQLGDKIPGETIKDNFGYSVSSNKIGDIFG